MKKSMLILASLCVLFAAGTAFGGWPEKQKLLASDGADGDRFGCSVSIDGSYAVVGAYFDDLPNQDLAGSAYVFEYDGVGWNEVAKLTASDAFAGDEFGFSVAISGDVVIVGSPKDDDNGSQSGSAYIFVKPLGGWVSMNETAKLKASDGAIDDRLGISVSISGDYAIAGAHFDNNAKGADAGAAYIFEKLAAGWSDMTETIKLIASDGGASEYAGFAVSISGDHALMSAHNNNNHGSAYVFKRGATWTEIAKLSPSDGVMADIFGSALCLTGSSGEYAVVGASGHDVMGGEGAAYVFEKPAGGWVSTTETAKLTASDAAPSDNFGFSVSIEGDNIIIGSKDDDNGTDSGSAYIFEKPTGGWVSATETYKIKASDGFDQDFFSWSVSISGGSAIVGAYCDDDNGTNSGSAYIFEDDGTGPGPDPCEGNAVSFSVNGLDDPHYDGVPAVPGNTYFMWPWTPPPVPPGLGPYPAVRQPGVPWAVGIITARPGDVADYAMQQIASEAEIFQSEPDRSQGGTVSNAPAGTNNQILKAIALGLRPSWFSGKDNANVNAYTFGEDFFNGDEDPQGGGPVYNWPWEDRQEYTFDEPIVTGGGLPIRFHFSIDPWAVGLAGTAVQDEATNQGALTLPAGPIGSADVYSALANTWQSDGEASGDVFSADPITSPGMNIQEYDDVILALLAPRPLVDLPGMEDDLDALEDVGTNTLVDGTAAESGNTHDRVAPTNPALNPPNGGVHPPDLGEPNNPNHDPVNVNPIIFSVDRGTYGRMGSAVHAQVQDPNEGASGDLFIAVTVVDRWGFISTTNMLLIDEGQLGLMPHDDLDAVIIKLIIDPGDLALRIEQAALQNYNPDGLSQGNGFTKPLLNNQDASEVVVGFSVDTSSIGQVGTAVDFECRIDGTGAPGVIPPASGVMEQAGDIFFSNLLPTPGMSGVPDLGTGLALGQNYLWFEEVSIGLDTGAWSFVAGGPSGNLGDLPDELNALDSLYGGEEPNEPNNIKWSQPPVPWDEPGVYVGWDEESHDWLPRMVADDFLCDTNDPITAIRWWGSFFNWYDNRVPPELPNAFYLTIWNDIPAGEPGEPIVKWSQYPDLYDTGIDVDVTVPLILADDFLCEITGPVTDIIIWGSWLDDYLPYGYDPTAVEFTLSFHEDIPDPDGTGSEYSKPGDPLWVQKFLPGSFTAYRYMEGIEEGWLDPPTMTYIFPADTVCWRYEFHIDPNDAFVQQGTLDDTVVYWLDVQADPCDMEARFGWKTSEVHWNDDAVWGDGVEPYMGPWFELRYPSDHQFAGESIDLAFEIITEPESGPEYSHPNEIVWENYCYAYDVNFYGLEFDPRTGTIDLPKFEFYQELDPEDHWYQPNDRGIYWLGIAAIYDGDEPNYPWGWETREHFFMDDAVRLFEWPVPGTKYPAEAFEPIEFEGVSWDLSFELISEDCYTGPDYAQWVSVGRPYCWCYTRQCHGDADGRAEGGSKTGYWYVGIQDLNTMVAGWKVKEPAIAPTPSGPGIATITYNSPKGPVKGICADFGHGTEGGTKTGYWHVGIDDLNRLVTHWKVKEPAVPPIPGGLGVPPDCLTAAPSSP